LNPETSPSEMDQESAGSSTAGEPAFIDAGLIRKPHGIKGEILVDIDEDLIPYFTPGLIVYIGEEHLKWSLVSIRPHKSGFLLLFNEIRTPEMASNYRFKKIFIPYLDRIQATIKDGELLDDQKLGLKVFTDKDAELGYIKEIIKTGANDVFVVEEGSKEILIPDIKDVVLKIDVKNQKMIVHIIPGLIPD